VSLPLPVTLIRFFVPECVLFFGMASFAHIRCRRTGVVLIGWFLSGDALG
jgi:hypothetical protein